MRKKLKLQNPPNINNQDPEAWGDGPLSNYGILILMKPSLFLELGDPIYYPQEHTLTKIRNRILENKTISSPLIWIKLPNENLKYPIVEGNSGRHRAYLIYKIFGDTSIPILLKFGTQTEKLIFKKQLTKNDISKILLNLNNGIISKTGHFIKGPLFKVIDDELDYFKMR